MSAPLPSSDRDAAQTLARQQAEEYYGWLPTLAEMMQVNAASFLREYSDIVACPINELDSDEREGVSILEIQDVMPEEAEKIYTSR